MTTHLQHGLTRSGRRLASAAAALALLVLPAACGTAAGAGKQVASIGTTADDGTATDGSTDGTTADSSPLTPAEAAADYAQCMRDHGVDMPDPQVGADGGMTINASAEPGDNTFVDADKACQPIMQRAVGDIEQDPEQVAEMQQQMLAFAQCMRDHGVDMPDPTFDNGKVTVQIGAGPPPDGTAGEDQPPDSAPKMDPKIQQANEECAKDLGLPTPATPDGAAPSGGVLIGIGGGNGSKGG